ncbi:Glutamate-tRNA ligase [Agrobacterium sp. DSM 25558]|uniref:tRNA glutamyl-Q(34) synthetase GluQRS n=1 Tax=Agrobacterium sp. DSM 25558 TaxID=1907665 RepID=UPI000972433F|nr:tRNA glutamyl-Q(34) synthetase GluQRS [Agrobacterium sp. DSM 25558]SCX07592.1 Glutamate-tRNA ligase [Agrobacterium sp. DSM 25558]
MSFLSGQKPVFRFAPSPNGRLHLGHALSAILNHDMAKDEGGRFLLRIEDIDVVRCTPELEQRIYEDLTWLGLSWDEPVRRQSENFDDYRQGLEKLIGIGLAYPSFMSRSETKAFVRDYEANSKIWPRDPDGAALYPPLDKQRPAQEVATLLSSNIQHAWRLDMDKAISHLRHSLEWSETGNGDNTLIKADPAVWGDVILSRSDAPSSYHLSVVLDDALQGVTHVVRGMDLFVATSIHRLLQTLLELPVPEYHHHRLVFDETGKKLSKSIGSTGLWALRAQGHTPSDIRSLLGV